MFRFLTLCVTVLCVALPASGAEPIQIEFRRALREAAPGYAAAEHTPDGRPLYLAEQAELTGDDVIEAKVVLDSTGRSYAVELTFSDEGGTKLAKLTTEHLNKPLAILIDGKCISAPTILSKLSKRAQITGNFDKAEAERIVANLHSRP